MANPKIKIPLHVVVLAAGRGIRMQSKRPKVLKEICGEPMLAHVLRTARILLPDRIHVVVSKDAHEVRKLASEFRANCVVQNNPRGTADAVSVALKRIPSDSITLVLFGDLPLVRVTALRQLVLLARDHKVGLRSMHIDTPAGYSRIIRDAGGYVNKLVTHSIATAKQRLIKEVDAGGMAFYTSWAKSAIDKVESLVDEKPLTDLVRLAKIDGLEIETVEVPLNEGMGVNTGPQLLLAQSLLSAHKVEEFAERGVLFSDPSTVAVHGNLKALPGAFIDRNVLIQGEVNMEAGSAIGPNCVVKDTSLAADATIHAFSHVEGARLGVGSQAGPFARLRPGTNLLGGVTVGNFAEVKQTTIGTNSKVKHFSFLGDGQVGKNVNIGAGTVFCNYDGEKKHTTHVGDDSFIGAGSMLIAPVNVNKKSMVAAGSVITNDVNSDTIAFGRARQKNVHRKIKVKKSKPVKKAKTAKTSKKKKK